jgi:hypothetical protein
MSLPVKHLEVDGEALDDRRLKGVKLETAGSMVSLADASASSWPAWLVVQNFPGAIRMRWLRVSGPTTPLYGEFRWLPDGDRKEYIGGIDIEHPPSPGDFGRVCRWLRAVAKKLPELGRPIDTSDLNGDELERATRRAIKTLLQECRRPSLNEGRRRVELELVAQILSRDRNLNLPRTNGKKLRDRLRYHNRPSFTQLREEEMHKLGFK